MIDSSSVQEDQQAILSFQKGSEEGFRFLFQKYQTRVIQLAFRFLRDPPEAEDVAQEVFLKIYTRAHFYQERAPVFAWIYRITVNTVYDHLRKRRPTLFSRLAPEGEEASEISIPDSQTASVRDALEEEERKKILGRALEELPFRLRTCLHLYHFEELPYEEIARILECTPKAVERRLYRAREILRKKLKKWRGELGV